MSASIHNHCRQATQKSLPWGTKNDDRIIFEISTHGTDPRVEPAGQEKGSRGLRWSDRRQTLISRVERNLAGRFGSGRVGSGGVENLTGQVEPGQEVFKSRGSGRVIRFTKSHGSGRVGSEGF